MNKKRLLPILILILSIVVFAGGMAVNAATEMPLPVTEFVTPQDGDTVSGTVPVIVHSPDQVTFCASPQKNVSLVIDGVYELPMSLKGDDQYVTMWNTDGVNSGKHKVTAIVVHCTNPLRVETIFIWVNVDNSSPYS